MRIEDEVKLDFSDVLFRPKRSTLGSRSEVDLSRKYTFLNYEPDFPDNVEDYHYEGVPIMAANMDGVGTFDMHTALNRANMFTCAVKNYDLTDWESNWWNHENIALSTGITESDLERTTQILDTIPDIKYVCIDVANGYSEKFLDFVARFRDKYPHKVIIAGNVVTAEITEELLLKGADIVKVGIGPGSVCTTRVKTGVGYPQLSAIIECADAAHGLGGHIIADGGCSCPGDVAKAFGAGADFVMLGGMLSGTDQGGGEVVDGKVKFYGMSSTAAQEKHGGTKNYRASEGRVVEVPYRGDVEPIVGDILGGVRSTCTYVGASSLKELSKRTTFVRVSGSKQFNTSLAHHTVGE